MPTSVANALVVLSAFAFFSPAFSVTHEPEAEKARQSIIPDTEDAAALLAGKGKGNLSIFADGNLTSIQSIQFGGGVRAPTAGSVTNMERGNVLESMRLRL
jgi:hypothetical protein